MEPPSEWYLIEQRKLLFKDEWLFYALLALLFFTNHWYMMVPVSILGATFVLYSYKRQWEMERQRFGPLTPDSNPSDASRSPHKIPDVHSE